MRTVGEVVPLLKRPENVVRKTIRSTRAVSRAVLTAERPLPNFLVIGTQRGGTTSLHDDLGKHGSLVRPIAKEIQFFTLNYDRNLRWYRAHFPHLLASQQTFESSPYYLFHPAAATRAAITLPAAKYIVLLRDPVSRAYSHYLHTQALGAEKLSFEDALDAEESRLAEAHRLGLDSPAGQRIHRRYSYKSRGMYAIQLERWTAAVGQQRLKVLKSEDWFREPGRAYADVLSFLGLPPFTPRTWARSNRQAATNPQKMASSTRDELSAGFRTDSERVRRLLGWERAWS